MSKYLISLILLSVISMDVSAQRITRQYNNGLFANFGAHSAKA
jgi:hypothetical protein